MSIQLLCELVGGPHDGQEFSLDGMVRSYPTDTQGTGPHVPGTVVIMLGEKQPKAVWHDSVHVCISAHPPLSVYATPRIGDTRYRYVGPYPCAVAAR